MGTYLELAFGEDMHFTREFAEPVYVCVCRRIAIILRPRQSQTTSARAMALRLLLNPGAYLKKKPGTNQPSSEQKL